MAVGVGGGVGVGVGVAVVATLAIQASNPPPNVGCRALTLGKLVDAVVPAM